MRKLLPFAAAAVLAALPASALAFDGTSEGTINAGGSVFYDSATANGARTQIEGHGGYYLLDALLVGGSVGYDDDDVTSVLSLAGLCRYHFLDAWFLYNNSRPGICSPYVGATLGLAHGKDPRHSDTGLSLGLQIGAETFLADHVALNVGLDFSMCTADV